MGATLCFKKNHNKPFYRKKLLDVPITQESTWVHCSTQEDTQRDRLKIVQTTCTRAVPGGGKGFAYRVRRRCPSPFLPAQLGRVRRALAPPSPDPPQRIRRPVLLRLHLDKERRGEQNDGKGRGIDAGGRRPVLKGRPGWVFVLPTRQPSAIGRSHYLFSTCVKLVLV